VRAERKGINDAVIQGIYDGLGVSADYLFMRVPKDYHNRIKLKTGGEREADKHELDHKDFKIASKTDLEVEMLSARREREQMRSEHAKMRRQLDDLSAKFEVFLRNNARFAPAE
jgi:hypothetical protein